LNITKFKVPNEYRFRPIVRINLCHELGLTIWFVLYNILL